MTEEQEFMDVQQQYTQCLKDINSWLYCKNSDVSYAKPSLAINKSAVNDLSCLIYVSMILSCLVINLILSYMPMIPH